MAEITTVEEALEQARVKWGVCPSEEQYRDWWDDIGNYSCSLCKYAYYIKQVEFNGVGFSCGYCPIYEDGFNCNSIFTQIQSEIDEMSYEQFRQCFANMHDIIFNLTEADFCHKIGE